MSLSHWPPHLSHKTSVVLYCWFLLLFPPPPHFKPSPEEHHNIQYSLRLSSPERHRFHFYREREREKKKKYQKLFLERENAVRVSLHIHIQPTNYSNLLSQALLDQALLYPHIHKYVYSLAGTVSFLSLSSFSWFHFFIGTEGHEYSQVLN